jgi:hypothetical protein
LATDSFSDPLQIPHLIGYFAGDFETERACRGRLLPVVGGEDDSRFKPCQMHLTNAVNPANGISDSSI